MRTVSRSSSVPNVETKPSSTTSVTPVSAPSAVNAGPSVYAPFSEAAYLQALAEHQPIVLFFFANWCPTCRVQEPIVQEVYSGNDLRDFGIRAFRVNFNGTDTDAAEKALAAQFGITYQHTFVMINTSGQEVARTIGHRNREQVIADALRTR